MKDFIGKLFITGQIELLTGMSIGCGGQSGIGLIDNPVIRDPMTDNPYIPGSSLKGRIKHALITISGEEKAKEICGDSAGKKKYCTSLVYVRDCKCLENKPKIEIKYENVIDHTTGTTKSGGPRQMERVVPGTIFSLELVYNYYSDGMVENDLKDLKSAIEFVEDEYLGGSGSRGYGKVGFHINKLIYKPKDYYLTGKGKQEIPVDTNTWVEKAKELIYGKVPAKV